MNTSAPVITTLDRDVYVVHPSPCEYRVFLCRINGERVVVKTFLTQDTADQYAAGLNLRVAVSA